MFITHHVLQVWSMPGLTASHDDSTPMPTSDKALAWYDGCDRCVRLKSRREGCPDVPDKITYARSARVLRANVEAQGCARVPDGLQADVIPKARAILAIR